MYDYEVWLFFKNDDWVDVVTSDEHAFTIFFLYVPSLHLNMYLIGLI